MLPKVINYYLYSFLFVFILSGVLEVGASNFLKSNPHLNKVELISDSIKFSSEKDLVLYREVYHLPFSYVAENQIVEFKLYPKKNHEILTLNLLSNRDYQILDSIIFFNQEYYHFRVQFNQLSSSDLLSLNFQIKTKNELFNWAIPLLAYTATQAVFYPEEEELYIGEEKIFEVFTNQIHNLNLSMDWQTVDALDYRFIKERDKVFIAIVAHRVGSHVLPISFKTFKPLIKIDKTLSFQLPTKSYSLAVKGSRLSFLKTEQRAVVFPKNIQEGVELVLENHRSLELGKTYRIELQEESGGFLVAELFTKTRLSNDKILGILRPYVYHSISEGYLFIKDGDQTKFITNFNIVPQVKINEIQVYREGKSWQSGAYVYPGETLEIRLKGEGLNRADFKFDELLEVRKDTVTMSAQRLDFFVTIPVDIKKSQIEIFNDGKKMQEVLKVIEHQKPKELDFVWIDYGQDKKILDRLQQALLLPEIPKDIIISFDRNKIDTQEVLFGKQYLEIEVRLLGVKNEVIELKKIDHVVVCPGIKSPRNGLVDGGDCLLQSIRLNDYLTKKTYDLDDWSKVEVTVKHQSSKYEEKGFSIKTTLVLQKKVTFDVDVSFPAGLLIKQVGVDGFPNVGGISLAMLANFTFYHGDKIQKERPFKVGAGFLAHNAFNFNPDVQNRDLGLLVMGSVYPIKKTKKLSFPLYAGFGYFLNRSRFFYLVGPGITVNL